MSDRGGRFTRRSGKVSAQRAVLRSSRGRTGALGFAQPGAELAAMIQWNDGGASDANGSRQITSMVMDPAEARTLTKRDECDEQRRLGCRIGTSAMLIQLRCAFARKRAGTQSVGRVRFTVRFHGGSRGRAAGFMGDPAPRGAGNRLRKKRSGSNAPSPCGGCGRR